MAEDESPLIEFQYNGTFIPNRFMCFDHNKSPLVEVLIKSSLNNLKV